MYRQNIQFPVKDTALREDVHALGELIGETLRDQGGAQFFMQVEGDRLGAIRRREGDSQGAADLEKRTEGRSAAAATELTRAFSIWFMAVNTAEKAHRVRRRREYLSDSSTSQPGGIADCIGRLQRSGVSLEAALELIGMMRIEPVFTAHPTESTRRTILRKQQRMAHDLLERHDPGSTRAELDMLWARVRLEVTSIWQTEEHPREGLTVVDEREHVLFYLIDILYRVVPLFYEEIEAALAHAYAVPAETLDVPNILRFGSWVGGDMDGNADVHGKTIRETLQRNQQMIVSTYFAECGQLAESLSQSANRVAVSAGLAGRIESYTAILPGAKALVPTRHDRMPYRVFFGQISERLQASYEGRPNAYQSPDELLSDIGLAAASLLENQAGVTPDIFWCAGSCGACRLSDFIWPPWTSFSTPASTMRSSRRAWIRRTGRPCRRRSGCGNCTIFWYAIWGRPPPSTPWAGAAFGFFRRSPRHAINSAAARSASTS